MSVALLIMAAASAGQAGIEFTAPSAETEEATRMQRKYPTRALADRQSAAALMDVEVDPTGRIVTCETVAIYGSKSLGQSICGLYKPVRVMPATVAGQPAYGAYRTLIAFYLPGDKQGQKVAAVRPVADAEFTVKALPDGEKTLRVGLKLLIAPDGAVSQCSSGGDKFPTFVGAACEQIAKVKFAGVKDGEGRPVQHVRSFSAEFSLAK
jgi:hypothetical protein